MPFHGLSVHTSDGVVEVPLAVEAAGPAAIKDYLHKASRKASRKSEREADGAETPTESSSNSAA